MREVLGHPHSAIITVEEEQRWEIKRRKRKTSVKLLRWKRIKEISESLEVQPQNQADSQHVFKFRQIMKMAQSIKNDSLFKKNGKEIETFLMNDENEEAAAEEDNMTNSDVMTVFLQQHSKKSEFPKFSFP
jgi:hypothetical protein